jgi:hypothetical protein
METLIIHTEGRKRKLIKELLKELGIDFETAKDTKSPYNPALRTDRLLVAPHQQKRPTHLRDQRNKSRSIDFIRCRAL